MVVRPYLRIQAVPAWYLHSFEARVIIQALRSLPLMRLKFISLFILLAVAVPSMAQVVDFSADRIPEADLNGSWRFHPGHDPVRAAPGFADSGWALLRTDAS
jgi:hypothetical protein